MNKAVALSFIIGVAIAFDSTIESKLKASLEGIKSLTPRFVSKQVERQSGSLSKYAWKYFTKIDLINGQPSVGWLAGGSRDFTFNSPIPAASVNLTITTSAALDLYWGPYGANNYVGNVTGKLQIFPLT